MAKHNLINIPATIRLVFCLLFLLQSVDVLAALQFNSTSSLTAGWPGDLPDKIRVVFCVSRE